MSVRRDAYTTKELTVGTWPDFVSLFSKGNGWDFCWCMHFQRPRTLPKGHWRRTRAERGVRNRRQKKELVEQGLAHGILVYAKGEPVGCCQYGPREELSRIDNKRNYQELSLGAGTENLWRISCFVTDKKHRRHGVASAALAAALESIRRKGGGVVEAYPMIPWEELCRARVRRCGHTPAFGNASTHGTLSMFERQGFKVVGPYGLSNVVVRKTAVGSKWRGAKVRSDNRQA
jgi:GNAT superfamily N-acetyltransferase